MRCAFARFVKGSKPGHGTGFDIDDNDLLEMEKCHGVVVASAIFGTRLYYIYFIVPFLCWTQ